MSHLVRSSTCSSSSSSSLGKPIGVAGDGEAFRHSLDGLHSSPLLFLFPLSSPDLALAYWPGAPVRDNGNSNIQEYQ